MPGDAAVTGHARRYLNGYSIVGSILFVLGLGSIAASFGVQDSDPHWATVLVGIGAGLLPTGTVVFLEPVLVRGLQRSARQIATRSAAQAVARGTSQPTATVIVLDGYAPVAGVSVLALSPNKTWKEGSTDRDGAAFLELPDPDLSWTVFVAKVGYEALVKRGWIPASDDSLTVTLTEQPDGGSLICPNGKGRIPGLAGRLNPKLDRHDHTYIYAKNIAIDGGQPQPVSFVRGRDMSMQDAHSNTFRVCVVEIIGNSSLIDYNRSSAS